VTYPQWLTNVVMARKKNGKWRMCTDFMDLNKCHLKDDFPLARIEKIVVSTAGCEMMTLLEYFLGNTTRYGFARKMRRKQSLEGKFT
jgi:hypothetical protein